MYYLTKPAATSKCYLANRLYCFLLSYNNRKDIIKLKKWNWICLLSYKCINNWLLVHFVFKNHYEKNCWMPYILVKVLENFVLVWQRKRKLPNQHWAHCNDNSFTNRWPESLHFNSRHCYVIQLTLNLKMTCTTQVLEMCQSLPTTFLTRTTHTRTITFHLLWIDFWIQNLSLFQWLSTAIVK